MDLLEDRALPAVNDYVLRERPQDAETTLVFLISGQFRVDVTGGSKTMTRQGDYIMWGPGIDHSWEALADSVVMTVRWPSIA